MAKHLFRDFLKDTDRILQLAQEMLEKHIRDKDIPEDNTEIIAKKQSELSKLKKRLGNLITMRADGEIDRKQFQDMKTGLDAKILILREQISKRSPRIAGTSACQ